MSTYPPPREQVAVPADRCLAALAEAERAWQRGRDEDAESLLLAARHGAMIAGRADLVGRAEVAFAEFCIAVDDDERAQGHVLAATGVLAATDTVWQTRLWLARSMLQRRSGQALDADQVLPDLDAIASRDDARPWAPLVAVEFAAWARERGDVNAAMRHATRAVALAAPSSRVRGIALWEQGEAAIAQQRWDDARDSFQSAIAEFRQLSLKRDEGRALSRYALAIAPHAAPGTDDVPATWLGRAQTVLGEAATWRDLASTRSGFRTHGRRMQDRAIGGGLATRIDLLEQAIGQMRNAISIWVDQADRSLGMALQLLNESGDTASSERVAGARDAVLRILEGASAQARSVSKLGRNLVEVIEAAVVERNRTRLLLEVLSELDRIVDREALGSAAALAALKLLEADQIVLARQGPREALVELGRAGRSRDPGSADLWRAAAEASLRVPSMAHAEQQVATREDARPRGPVMVVPMRAAGITGALYADKLRRSGQFTEQDHQLARLFSDYFALVFSRLAAVEAKRMAFEQLATTLDTIRDGVLALDHRGIVTHVNTAAARMLRVESPQLVGAPIDAHASLAPLAQLLNATRRVDGSLVRLRHGSFIVTARPIESESSARGVVATLVELDRAQRIAQRVTAARPRYTLNDVLGESPAIRQALHVATQAAAVDASVLITGESGTGKEVFAQAIHTTGARANEPFVGVNCAAVPRELLEAELFGYERGAFTGARTEGNLGKFELAGEGTILLDEVGDMPVDMQAKLLRVLQERVLVRLGGSAERSVRARVIATTHRDLDALVKAGRFRHDLLFRLRVLHIHLPPLSSREDDVVLLAKSFLLRFAQHQRKDVRDFSDAVVQQLRRHRWPGNVRELANVVEREVSLAPADVRVLEVLQTPLTASQPAPEPEFDEAGTLGPEATILPIDEVEKRAFLRALEICEGNVQKASRALGVSKVTFYAKLRAWGMHPKDHRLKGLMDAARDYTRK